MSRKTKTKPETNLQLMAEDSAEGKVVVTIDSGTSEPISEKKKQDAEKPLYLKRV